MGINDAYRKETIHLWIAIAVLLALSAARLLSFLFDLGPLVPEARWISNALSLGVVLLLWIAYGRWCQTIRRRKELEFVIQGIGPDMIMVVDPDRRIRLCNDAVTSVFGYLPREVIGATTDLLYFDRRVTSQRHEVYDRIQQIGFHTGFAKGKRKDGTIIPLEIVTGELPYEPGAVILVRDITERKRAETELIKAKENAEQANADLQDMVAMRDRLTHMIVHDLKSPLTAINGYLELMTRSCGDRLEEKEMGFLQEASRLTGKMASMINTLLDLRRLESKDMPIHCETCDLRELAGDAVQLLGPEADMLGIEIEIPATGASAWCDRNLMSRVLVNLLGNAVKFTPRNGQVRFAFEQDADTVTVRIADTGSGIPAEFHERIFERFAQIEVRQFSTGLGLAFCKLAVEAHHGAIGVESEEGKGSTFWFTLPATEEVPHGTDADIAP